MPKHNWKDSQEGIIKQQRMAPIVVEGMIVALDT